MRRFTGIEASTGFDYDADNLQSMSDQLSEDDAFCEQFAKLHAGDLVAVMLGTALPVVSKRLQDNWYAEVKYKMEEESCAN